jgi:hypothetical protein
LGRIGGEVVNRWEWHQDIIRPVEELPPQGMYQAGSFTSMDPTGLTVTSPTTDPDIVLTQDALKMEVDFQRSSKLEEVCIREGRTLQGLLLP